MDYLTILSTCSLILFPHPTAGHYTSPLSSPNTPTLRTSCLLLAPSPTAIPVSSILYADSDTAYFLVRHVLSYNTSSALAGMGGCGVLGKEAKAEAEVMAWKEVDRAKMCVLALGKWFASSQPGRVGMDEAEMKEIAERYGVGIKTLDRGVYVNGEEDRDVAKSVGALKISVANGGGERARSHRFRDDRHLHVHHGHDDANAHSLFDRHHGVSAG